VNDQREASNSFPQTACTNQIFEPAGPWLWTQQIREALGEDGELDPMALEESWASGLPVQLEAFRSTREDVPAAHVGAVGFAELNDFGNFFFAAADTQAEKRRHCSSPSNGPACYTANWMRDPIEEPSPKRPTPGAASEDGWENAYVANRPNATTYQGACDILCVVEDCSETQVKAAYRRMVRAWHPDRLDKSDESVRAFATEKMVAINEAYHYLRGVVSLEVR
jgi:hypothetical protein